MHSLANRLLVANPTLLDHNFYHGVVFLIEHNEGGALGVIINRPLEVTIGDVWDGCPESLATATRCAEGGPVERDRGILLHTYANVRGSHRLPAGLLVGGDDGDLRQAIQQDTGRTELPRIFLGHSGWSPGQLEGELQRGGWLIRRAHRRWVLGGFDPEELWLDLVQCGNLIPDASLN